MEHCPHCGASVQKGQRFCAGCGGVLDIARESEVPKPRQPSKKKRRFPTWVIVLIGGIVVALIACCAIGLFYKPSPEHKATTTARATLRATKATKPTNTPRAIPEPSPTSASEPTEGTLWCPDCAAESLEINLWEKGQAKRGKVVAKAYHGDKVDVLDKNYDDSEERYYYLVKVKETGVQGWVPETLIQLEPVNEQATIVEDKVVYHIVQQDETLAIIAEKYGATIEQILGLNDIEDPNVLKVGQKLIVSVPADWIPSPTTTSQPTRADVSTPTLPSALVSKGAATTGVNLRAGPGTNYPKAGGLKEGETIEIVARTSNGEWYKAKLSDGKVVWVAATYIAVESDVELIPTASPADIPAMPTSPPTTNTPRPAPTSTPVPQPTATPRPVCDCGGDYYNCDSFSSWSQAQACYNYCVSIGRGDIHRLDQDNNGTACESLR